MTQIHQWQRDLIKEIFRTDFNPNSDHYEYTIASRIHIVAQEFDANPIRAMHEIIETFVRSVVDNAASNRAKLYAISSAETEEQARRLIMSVGDGSEVM